MSLTTLFSQFNLTRDSAWWLWGKILSVATLITSGVLDLTFWAQYVGLHPSISEVHIVQVLAIIALYISGQYSTSSLPGKN